jgi:hypothetical protein
MKYHKNITIDNLQTIQEQAQRLIPVKYNIFPGLIYIPNNKELFLSIPELVSVLSRLRILNYVGAIAINTFWKTTSPIHKDYGSARYSLNIPLCGYKGTYLEYFTTDQDPIKKPTTSLLENSSGVHYFDYPIENCKLDEVVPTDCPLIVDTLTPHRFINPYSEMRRLLLIRLDDCPEVDAIIENL